MPFHRDKEPELRYGKFLSTGKNHRILVDERNFVNILAKYNSEKDRGIMHTPEWIAEMEILQERFDNGELT